MPQQIAALRQLQAAGIADERVAVSGQSYGGYLSAWALGHTDLFRAAVVIAPVVDIEAHWGSSDSGFYSDPYAMKGDFPQNQETMRRLCPIHYAQHTVTPTLILQGEKDERCPRTQAEALFVALRRGGNPRTELVIYPGGSHAFMAGAKPSQRVDAVRRVVAWLGKWVGGR